MRHKANKEERDGCFDIKKYDPTECDDHANPPSCEWQATSQSTFGVRLSGSLALPATCSID